MKWTFDQNERAFGPTLCEYWQTNRIPKSPLSPYTRSMQWLFTDSEDNYRKRGNKAFSENSISYEFNRLGYRGPEFELKEDEVGVMFLGDSNTLGVGMPWDGLWTSLVTNHLQKRWGRPVRQYNLAWAGTGSDYTAMMIHQTAEVLRPKVVFILWSYVSRMTWFAVPDRPVYFKPQWYQNTYLKEHSAYLRLATAPQTFFNYVRNFHLVNDRLSRLGIPYIWGNLEEFSDGMLAPYLPLDGFAGRWRCLDLARDARHAGLETHSSFAASVVKVFENRYAGIRISPNEESKQRL